ncbi:RHO1 GDP-GTP exchange protein 2 [Gonapodya sp. JEL0774]|nr:RHO1 GDP-GTP exchange protein 2 [Gonapodya sp. JEL0774]
MALRRMGSGDSARPLSASPSLTLVEGVLPESPASMGDTDFEQDFSLFGLEEVLTETAAKSSEESVATEAEEWIRRSMHTEDERWESQSRDEDATLKSTSPVPYQVIWPLHNQLALIKFSPGIFFCPSTETSSGPESDDDEIVRQEAIFELIKIQCEFTSDLRSMCKYIEQLRLANTMDSQRLHAFIRVAFANMDGDMMYENSALAELLRKRQKEFCVVEHIGDVLLSKTGMKALRSFAQYGKNQFYSQWWVKNEKAQNPSFAAFVDAQSRLPQYRRLPLEAFITRPSTHLGRLPLLAGVILERTPTDNPDHVDLQAYVRQSKAVLKQIDTEVAKVNTLGTQRLTQPADISVMPQPAIATRSWTETRMKFSLFKSPTR